MSVGEVIDRQTVATRELVQIRHPARRIRVTLILERNDENPIKRRYHRLSSCVSEGLSKHTGLGVGISHSDIDGARSMLWSGRRNRNLISYPTRRSSERPDTA